MFPMIRQRPVHPAGNYSIIQQRRCKNCRRPLAGPTSNQTRSKSSFVSKQHHNIQIRNIHPTSTKCYCDNHDEECSSSNYDDDDSSVTSSSTSTSRRKSRRNRHHQLFARMRDRRNIQSMIDQGYSLQYGGGGGNGTFLEDDDCTMSSLSGCETDYSTSSGSDDYGIVDDRLCGDKQRRNHPFEDNGDAISSSSSSAESEITEKIHRSDA